MCTVKCNSRQTTRARIVWETTNFKAGFILHPSSNSLDYDFRQNEIPNPISSDCASSVPQLETGAFKTSSNASNQLKYSKKPPGELSRKICPWLLRTGSKGLYQAQLKRHMRFRPTFQRETQKEPWNIPSSTVRSR